MSTKLKHAGKFIGFWVMYGLMMVLACIIWLLDFVCDCIDWLLQRMEKVLHKLDYFNDKESDTDNNSGV